jgi:hypothetical protein
MLEGFNISTQIIIFLLSGSIIWYFSHKLSHIVDFLNDEFKLGAI